VVLLFNGGGEEAWKLAIPVLLELKSKSEEFVDVFNKFGVGVFQYELVLSPKFGLFTVPCGAM
jgi:hypothetical protein